jgi:hypothetical protein
MKALLLFFLTVSVISSAYASTGAPNDGTYATGCFIPRNRGTTARTMSQFMRIHGDSFALTERFYSDGACKALTMSSSEEGLLAKSEAAPSTRALSSYVVSGGDLPSEQLAENGGPVFLRKIKVSAASADLLKEGIAFPKPSYYEAYGSARELNDIAEIHLATPTNFKFRFSTYNLITK